MFIHGTPYFWPRKLLTLFELVQKDLCMTSLYAKGGGAVQIAEQIAARIKGGTLRPGELLPPVRQLAAELEVNANTVASAYARLRDAGLVATRGRAGTVVLEPPLAAVSAAYTPRQCRRECAIWPAAIWMPPCCRRWRWARRRDSRNKTAMTSAAISRY